jgi:hypothetical protein
MNKKPSEIFETPEASGFDKVINKQPERTVDEIVSNIVAEASYRCKFKKTPYTDGEKWLVEELTQTLQAERQKRDEMVSRIATFAEHRATCFLYSCEDEEYQNSKCDCGLYQALTQPNNPN